RLDRASSQAYHIAASLRLRGDLDGDALGRALDRIVARHEVLRTVFEDGPSGPRQRVRAADAGFALGREDLRGQGGEARARLEAAQVAAVVEAPFDLAHGPLIRGSLLRLSDDEWRLLVTQHHIVSDGWSIGVLVRELTQFYAAEREGVALTLEALPVQYADYAQWQRGWLQGEVWERQARYWREYLSGAPALLALPTDRPRPLQRSYAGGRVSVGLSRALSEGLRALARRHGATLFMVLLAGWGTLLSRLSGQKDVVVGTPVANRRHPATEGLIGFFVNTLALRVRLDDDPTVSGLLGRLKQETLEAYAHQDLPFEQVVEAVNPPRSLGHSPLFQAMLGLNNTGKTSLELPGLTLEHEPLAYARAQFDLSLLLDEEDGAVVGSLEYASDLFDEGRMRQWLSHWEVLLEGMVSAESAKVSGLPWLTALQRREVIDDFNATAVPYPSDLLVHELFQAQAARTP
ncbi:condensation domain-containing protein, partial [Luteibacter sp. PPL201]